MILVDMWKAIGAGKEIADPTKWKNVQNLTNSISIILTLALGLYRLFVGELPISDDSVIKISSGIATLLLAFNNVITTVTTKKDVTLTGS